MMRKFTIIIGLSFIFIFNIYSQQKSILIFDPTSQYEQNFISSLKQIYTDSINSTSAITEDINNYNALFLFLKNDSYTHILSQDEGNLLINYLQYGGSIYINSYINQNYLNVDFWNYIGIEFGGALATFVYVDSLDGIDSTFLNGLNLNYRFSSPDIPVLQGNVNPVLHAYATLDFTAVYESNADSIKVLYDFFPYYIYNLDYLTRILNYFNIPTVSPDYLKWWPMQVGNKWVYEVDSFEQNRNQQYEFEGYRYFDIIDYLTLQNNKSYFKVINQYVNNDKDTLYLRIDSTTQKIFIYQKDNSGNWAETLYEDLSADINDTVCTDYSLPDLCQYVSGINNFNNWGFNTFKKTYRNGISGFVIQHSLVKDIGFYSSGMGDLNGTSEILKAFRINGISYGDTLLLGIKDKPESNLINDFQLSQNYPNPFNPATKIGFRIAEFGFVSLKVYDVLGREVATLVNEEKKPGTYEVNFNASNFSSGIYFYRIKTGSFIQTKKILLLK